MRLDLQGCISMTGSCWCVLLLILALFCNRRIQSMDLTSALAIYSSEDLVDPPREGHGGEWMNMLAVGWVVGGALVVYRDKLQ
jgi:hypothetical protein